MVQGKFSDLSGELHCDKPNNRIHRFQGILHIEGQAFPVTNNNILLRVRSI